MVLVLGITVAGCYKVQPLPLQILPFAQPDPQSLSILVTIILIVIVILLVIIILLVIVIFV